MGKRKHQAVPINVFSSNNRSKRPYYSNDKDSFSLDLTSVAENFACISKQFETCRCFSLAFISF